MLLKVLCESEGRLLELENRYHKSIAVLKTTNYYDGLRLLNMFSGDTEAFGGCVKTG